MKKLPVNATIDKNGRINDYFQTLMADTGKKVKDLVKTDNDFKTFQEKMDKESSKMDQLLTVKKAFANNKMTLTLKITAVDLKPEIKSRGTASKDIEITFATA